jgi:TRAP transporter 4TM/12TM fusion protein
MEKGQPGKINNEGTADAVGTTSSGRYRSLKGFWRAMIIVPGAIVILLGINTVFDLRFFVDYHLYSFSLYFIVFGLLLASSFLRHPVKHELREPWASRLFGVDAAICFAILSLFAYFAVHGQDMIVRGWERFAPLEAVVFAVIAWFLILESVRRIYGLTLFIVITVVSFYPLIAEHMPGLLEGVGRPFDVTAMFHILSNQSAIGLLLRTYIEEVLGFIVFGVVVIETGGGETFLKIALAIVGRLRGAPAKVAVIASAMLASINGQPMVNVLTTGSVTIPAMKKAGFAPHVAGAVEVCASTGGTFTPPIMGISAFIMASFLGISYATVALAAAIPAFLYYLGLYVQIDAYTAVRGMKGQRAAELPSLVETLKYGWFYIPGILVLIYLLFFERLIGIAAFLGAATILILAQIRKESRFTWPKFLTFMENSASTLSDLIVVIGAVGMLVGVFSLTGIGVTFARELLSLSGGNLALLLILGLVTGFVMGMGMTLLAVYIFLAIVLAPALVAAKIEPLAAHLYCLYVGMLSYITPPIAMAVFPAAVLARSKVMKTGWTAVMLGSCIYILPFLFVLDPRLILHGDFWSITFAFVSTAFGILILASALGKYMIGLGPLWAESGGGSFSVFFNHGYILRALLVLAGVSMGLPWLYLKIMGLVIIAAILLPLAARKLWGRNRQHKLAGTE